MKTEKKHEATSPLVSGLNAAAKFIGVSRSAFCELARTDPTFPRAVAPTPRRVCWFAADLIHWLEGKRRAV